HTAHPSLHPALPTSHPQAHPPPPPADLLHHGGQPAPPRGRRVRRARSRLARGPPAAHLPAERGRDTAPLRRPPRPRAHELLRDQIGRAHVLTPVTWPSRMPSSA